MHRTSLLITLGCALAVGTQAQQQTPALHFDGNSWWAHVKVLADDNMEGRQTGSDGLRRTASV